MTILWYKKMIGSRLLFVIVIWKADLSFDYYVGYV